MHRRFCLLTILAVCCLLLAGCGGPTETAVAVKGKVQKNGAPPPVDANAPPGEGGYIVKLIPVPPNGMEHVGEVAPDGSFSITAYNREGEALQGVPPGKYTVVVYKLGQTQGEGAATAGALNVPKEVEIPADVGEGGYDLGVIELK